MRTGTSVTAVSISLESTKTRAVIHAWNPFLLLCDRVLGAGDNCRLNSGGRVGIVSCCSQAERAITFNRKKNPTHKGAPRANMQENQINDTFACADSLQKAQRNTVGDARYHTPSTVFKATADYSDTEKTCRCRKWRRSNRLVQSFPKNVSFG